MPEALLLVFLKRGQSWMMRWLVNSKKGAGMKNKTNLNATTRRNLLTTPVPTISATLFAYYNLAQFIPGISPLESNNSNFVGTAFTMRALPVRADLLQAVSDGSSPNLHRQAMATVKKGQVLVTDCGGQNNISFFGELISTYLKKKGVAAIVTDAGIADTEDVARTGLPVFAQGSAPVPGAASSLVLDLNCPINCMGVTIMPNDVIVGDSNGVVAIPRQITDKVAELAEKKERMERFLLKKLQEGAPLDGTYPPDKKTLELYKQYTKSK